MAVRMRASVGDEALDYIITDSYGIIYWKDSFLPDHIESFGRGDEFLVYRGNVAMKIDPFIPMNYVKSSFAAAEAKFNLPVTQVSDYKVTDTRSDDKIRYPTASALYGFAEDEYKTIVQYTHKQQAKERDKFLQKERDFQRQQENRSKTADDINGMSMSEYTAWRSQTSSLAPSPAPRAPMTVFDQWKKARDKFIKGDIDDIELVLKHVREEEPGYSRLVDMEIAEERASKEVGNGVHKHGFNWRRWPAWRWLVAWLHK